MNWAIEKSMTKTIAAAIVLLLILCGTLGNPPAVSASLIAWGANNYGQVGNGQSGSSVLFPVAVDAFECTPVLDAVASNWSSLALTNARTDNTYTWGGNTFSELGPPAINEAFITAPRLTSFTSGVSVAAGGFHMLATRIVDGEVKLYAWGNSNYGQAGVMGDWNVATPIEIALPGNPAPTPTAIDGGDLTSIAVGSDNKVYTWGNNVWCQLTWQPRYSHSAVPGAVLTSSGPLTDVILASAGYAFGVAIDKNYAVWTWGQNTKCQLGTTEVRVGRWGCTAGAAGMGLPAFEEDNLYPVSISAGAEHAIVLLSNGRVFAWGNNAHGELGQGTTSSYNCTALEVPGLPKIVKIAAGGYHNLALDQEGKVWAWGWNADGQIGDGSQVDRPSPVDISSSGALSGLRISNIRAGWEQSMAW